MTIPAKQYIILQMDVYTLTSIILTLAIFIAYINHRFIRIPTTIAIMIGAILISVISIIIEHTTQISFVNTIKSLLIRTDFHNLLLNGMLSFFLFAGAIHIDLSTLKSEKWEITTLSLFSTTASTIIVGFATYYLLPLMGLEIHLPLLYCLLFGALISPTDPIAVLAIVKEINAPKRLDTIISGEALFNDGIAIVLFVTLFDLAFNHVPVTTDNIISLFAQRAIGGLAFGVALGYIATFLIKACRDTNIIILITIAIVMGGYNLAMAINISGPLAMVAAGIIVGDKLQKHLSKENYNAVSIFWNIIDELLNAVLFLLIGFEMLVLHTRDLQYVAIICSIPIVLASRFITVAIPIKILQLFGRKTLPYTVRLLSWGGLRGGLAIALALSMKHDQYRGFILAMTYGVVAFSIIIQGLSVKPLAKRAKRAAKVLINQ